MDSESESLSGQAEALLGLASAGKYDDLEAAWMGAIEADALAPGEVEAVLRAVAAREGAARREGGRLESLLWFLLSDWADRKGPAAALDVARAVADILPGSKAMREQAADLYRRRHAAVAAIGDLAAMTLLVPEVPLADGMRHMEIALSLPPGTYVRDERRRSPGRVVGVDAARRGLEVSFGESRKVYDAPSLEGLERLEADDFRALVAFEAQRAGALGWEDPAALVRLALKAVGPRLALVELKAHLEPVIPAADWGRWWKAARPLLRRAADIEMTEGSRPDLVLRTRPMTFEDQVRRDFEALASVEERLGFVLEHLADSVEDLAAEAPVLRYLAERLEREAEAAGDPAAALGARAVLREVRHRLPAPVAPGATDAAPAAETLMPDAPAAVPSAAAAPADAPAAVLDAADVPGLLKQIASDALVEAVLGYLRDAAGARWPEIFAAALPVCSPAMAEWVASELAGGGHETILAEAVAAVLARPVENAGALVWVWRAACGESPVVALPHADRYAAATGLLSAADDLKRAHPGTDESAQRYLGDVQRALAAKEYAALRGVLAEAGEDQARALRVLAVRNAGLTDLARLRLLEVIRETHPGLHVEKAVPPWEEDAVYTTEDALHARQKEFEDLVHVQMVRNSEAIGRAAARGDLSENAEFTAALEERDRLTERANRMQEDLAKARLIRRSLAESDHVTIGSRVRARNLASGAEETLVFLGPWDAAPERGMYYYRTAIGLAFMGKKVGETVVLKTGSDERRWEVLETGPAL